MIRTVAGPALLVMLPACGSGGSFAVDIGGAFETDLAGAEVFYEEFLPTADRAGGSQVWFQKAGPADEFWVVEVNMPAGVSTGMFQLETPSIVLPGPSAGQPDDRFRRSAVRLNRE